MVTTFSMSSAESSPALYILVRLDKRDEEEDGERRTK